MAYKASDWYWVDAHGEIFGSASGGLVASADSAYQNFLAAGNVATPDPSDDFAGGSSGNLDSVLTAAGLPASGLSLATNKTSVIAAASSVCSAIVGAVFAGPTQQAAFSNAGMMVAANGGSAPSTGAAGTAFTALATAYGMSQSAFATLVSAMQLASLSLENSLATLVFAATAAATNDALSAAITAFETSVGVIVTSVNAAITATNSPALVAIEAPATISIKGVNA
jgi:hypothetical protein